MIKMSCQTYYLTIKEGAVKVSYKHNVIISMQYLFNMAILMQIVEIAK